MPSTATDRLQGLTTSVAVKAPCAAVTTTAVTLSGEQTVGGVACVTGDRVLVAIAGGSVNNGIWVVDTGAWSRAKDFDGTRDVVTGTVVLVKPTMAGRFWQVTTDGAIVPGLTVIDITQLDPSALSADASQVAFTYAVNYAVGTLGGVAQTFGIDPTQPPYNADPTGVADCSAALAAIWAAFPGRPIQFPAGSFKFTAKTEFFSSDNVSIFGPSVKLRGAGIGVTFIENAVVDDVMWDFNADTLSPIELSIGLQISDMTIRKSGSIGVNSAIRIGNGYHCDIEHLHIFGGYIGIEMVNGTTADDGWNMVRVRQSRIENCTKWGIKADGSEARNEGSFTILDHVFIQACGTAATTYSISGISKASAAAVSASGHPFVNGDDVYIQSVGGMTEVSGRYLAAGVVPGVSFTLQDVDGNDIDSSAFTTYTSGGTCELIPDEPDSGGMIYKGQVLQLNQCAWTLCENVGFMVKGQAGLAVCLYSNGCTWENNKRRHILCTGISNWQAISNQFHANTAFPHHTGVEFRGDFTIRDVNWQGVIWRNNDTAIRSTAFRLSGANVDLDTCRIDPRFITWDNYDLWAGQQRFDGWRWDAIPIQCVLVPESVTSLALRPSTQKGGATMPLRLRGGNDGVPSTTGEWAPIQLGTTGRSLTNSGLANSTRYYCYLYDNIGTPEIELSTTGWAIDADSGYRVKSDDATRLYVGSVETDGSAQFKTSAGGWLDPLSVPGSQPGIFSYLWVDSTGDLRISASLPASDTAGAIVGTQS